MESKLKEAQIWQNKKNRIRFELEDSLENFGNGKKYFIKTYGCQMNEHDTENIKAILESMGYLEIDDMDDSDLILLNTCAIRENVHNKVYGMLGRIKHLKMHKNNITVGICGCMAHESSVIEEIKNKYKWINIVFGTHNIHELPSLLETAFKSNKQEIEVLGEKDIVEDIPVKRESKYKAWVNIMYGCDKFCTYCIVPYTRGKQRSRDSIDIISEVKNLINDGYLEVTLLGQNVNAYGKDLNIDYTLSNLLKDIALTGIKRIRFITSHPWDFTDEMIDVISEYPNIMPYIHLPIQSGSNSILKLMGRKYTREEYLILYNKIKKKIPFSSVTTDIIVGFPGETEEDFKQTLDIVDRCKFDSAFTFIFSKRERTPACRLIDDTSLKEKESRLHRLNELVNSNAASINKTYLGRIVPVLVESVSEKDDMVMGYTDTMKLVNVKADINTIGSIIDVKITDAKTFSLDGIVTKTK